MEQQPVAGLNSRSMMMAALLAGVGIGLLSSIPLIACVNCLLLAWVWGGGIGAVYLYRRYERQPLLTTTQGIVLGAAAGAVGAVIAALVALLFTGLDATVRQMISDYTGSTGQAIGGLLLTTGFSIIGLFVRIIIYAVVGAIGGIIATALIWKAPATLPPPPPPYTPPTAGPTL